ncbi:MULTISPECIES: ISAs1 family transposase [Streptomyces]|uniref:ISAs1 family transposase n=1 Tax=Streptomyces TaxID=1883 RepID=UPI00142DD920|nr:MULTISPECIES: ISAs1 family transposase [Streptomyces]
MPYGRAGARLVAPEPPSRSTVWRVATGADASALDRVVGGWLLERAAELDAGTDCGALTAWSVDGKALRGAKHGADTEVRLLAAVEHGRQLVVSQVQLAKKSNEIPAFRELLKGLAAQAGLQDVVFTADALHTQHGHARALHAVDADFVFQAKGNQPRLFAALDALGWDAVPVGHEATVRGHGRVVRRTMQVMPSTTRSAVPTRRAGLPVRALRPRPAGPAGQRGRGAGRHQPHRRPRRSGRTRRPGPRAVAAGGAALPAGHPLHRGSLPRPHPLRPPRHGHPAQPRIGAHRLAGRTGITEATRWAGRAMHRPFDLLGLPHGS